RALRLHDGVRGGRRRAPGDRREDPLSTIGRASVALALATIAAGPVAHAGDKAGLAAAKSQAAARGGTCADSDGAALWWSPLAPVVGGKIKILAVGEGDGGELAVAEPGEHGR